MCLTKRSPRLRLNETVDRLDETELPLLRSQAKSSGDSLGPAWSKYNSGVRADLATRRPEIVVISLALEMAPVYEISAGGSRVKGRDAGTRRTGEPKVFY